MSWGRRKNAVWKLWISQDFFLLLNLTLLYAYLSIASHCLLQPIDIKTSSDKCPLLSLFLGQPSSFQGWPLGWHSEWTQGTTDSHLCCHQYSTARSLSCFGLSSTESNIMDVDLRDVVFMRNYCKLQLWLYVFTPDTLENDYNYIEKRVQITWWAFFIL